jgi:hypothetical protein
MHLGPRRDDGLKWRVGAARVCRAIDPVARGVQAPRGADPTDCDRYGAVLPIPEAPRETRPWDGMNFLAV